MGYLITLFCQAANHLYSVIACFCEGSHGITCTANKLRDFVLKFLLGLTQYSIMSSSACMWWKGREVVLEKGESPHDPQPKTVRYIIFMVRRRGGKVICSMCKRSITAHSCMYAYWDTYEKRCVLKPLFYPYSLALWLITNE